MKKSKATVVGSVLLVVALVVCTTGQANAQSPLVTTTTVESPQLVGYQVEPAGLLGLRTQVRPVYTAARTVTVTSPLAVASPVTVASPAALTVPTPVVAAPPLVVPPVAVSPVVPVVASPVVASPVVTSPVYYSVPLVVPYAGR